MVWPIVAAVGLGAVQKGLARSAQNKAIIAENEADIGANTRNTIRTGVKAGLLLLQEANARRSQAALKFGVSGQAQEVLGSINANTAAAGQAGASVRAVASDVARKLDSAQTDLDNDWDLKAQNYLTQMDDLYTGLRDSIQSGRSKAPGNFGMDLLGSALSVAGSYAGAKMNLGLGTPAK